MVSDLIDYFSSTIDIFCSQDKSSLGEDQAKQALLLEETQAEVAGQRTKINQLISLGHQLKQGMIRYIIIQCDCESITVV